MYFKLSSTVSISYLLFASCQRPLAMPLAKLGEGAHASWSPVGHSGNFLDPTPDLDGLMFRQFSFAACIIGYVTAWPWSLLLDKRATCNGYSSLCSRSYGNITYIGSHDSYAIDTNPLDLSRNQEVSLTAQLNLGVRLLQSQAHIDDGELRMCHSSCILYDGGLVLDYMKTVKTWLDSNPNEVLTLLVTNPDTASLTQYWKPAFENSGIASLAYVPSTWPLKRSAWPTLGELINTGKRVVIFMDYGYDTSVLNYVLPEFQAIWEPPYDSTNDTFPCSVDRISGSLSTGEHMYMLNHFLDVNFLGILIPDRDAADTTNSAKSILANAAGCLPVSQSGQNPNFVLLDWVDTGEAMNAAKQLNGV